MVQNVNLYTKPRVYHWICDTIAPLLPLQCMVSQLNTKHAWSRKKSPQTTSFMKKLCFSCLSPRYFPFFLSRYS